MMMMIMMVMMIIIIIIIISLVPALTPLYLYVSTFRSIRHRTHASQSANVEIQWSQSRNSDISTMNSYIRIVAT